MKFLKVTFCALLCVLLLAGCAKMPETDFSENSPLLIGTWRLVDYVPDNGKDIEWAKENIVWADEDILFTYNADGTGVKTVKGVVEYTFTYSFDGKYLYTTATYPSGKTNLMKDITTVDGDKVTTYSYDEKATITFQREKAAATTTDAVTIVTTSKEATPIKPTSAPTTVPTTTKPPTTVQNKTTVATTARPVVVQAADPTVENTYNPPFAILVSKMP